MKMTRPSLGLLATLLLLGWSLSRLAPAVVPSGAAPSGGGEGGPPRQGGGAKAAGSDPAGRRAGADAEGPGEIPPRGWWTVLRRAGTGFSQDRVMAEAAGVTFYVLLALFPAIASLISIYGLFADPAGLRGQLDGLQGLLPGGGIDIIREQVTALTGSSGKALGFGAVVGLLASLWSSNAGMKSLFDALNVVYHEREERGFVRLTLVSFAFTLGAIAFVILALLAVVALPVVLNLVALGGAAEVLLRLARWPLMVVVVGLALTLIYRYGPSRTHARWQWVSWGGVAAALGWVLVSLAFSYYVAHFGSYNKTYGSLGAAIGFMTWIWISSIVVLMGAELNAELEQQTGRDSTVGPDRPQGMRGAFKADTKS